MNMILKKLLRWVWFPLLLFITVDSYADVHVNLTGDAILYKNNCNTTAVNTKCQFKIGEQIKAPVKSFGDCLINSQRSHMVLQPLNENMLPEGDPISIYDKEVSSNVFVLAGKAVVVGWNLITGKPIGDIRNIFGDYETAISYKDDDLVINKAGNYQLHFYSEKSGPCSGYNQNGKAEWGSYYFTILPAPIITANLENPAFSPEEGVYKIPYQKIASVGVAINIKPPQHKTQSDIDRDNTNEMLRKIFGGNAIQLPDPYQLKHCLVIVEGVESDYSKQVISQVDNLGQKWLFHPAYIKPGQQVVINSYCQFASGATAQANSIHIQRNQANFGSPHFTLSDGGGSFATPDNPTPVDWQADKHYTIKVSFNNGALTTPESCDHDGEKVDTHKMLPSDSVMKSKRYADYQQSVTINGRCYIGYKSDSPYRFYPHEEIIDNSFSIVRNAPRIVTHSSFAGSYFGAANPDGEHKKLRPGGKVNVAVMAKLNGDYPHAQVRVASQSNALVSHNCPKGSILSGHECVFSLPSDRQHSGEWELSANNDLMERTSAVLNMVGANYELNEESGNVDIDNKQITITPEIILSAKPLWVDDAFSQKVFHYGRKFNLAMQYEILGKIPQTNELNTKYKGELTALDVTLDGGVKAGSVAAGGSVKIADKSIPVNSAWNGEGSFIANQTALQHDQVINLSVPFEVIQEQQGTASIAVLGSFTPSNVDIAANSVKLQPQLIHLQLGDKLLPANQVYSIDINKNQPLSVSPDSPDSLLTVEFNSLLAAEKLELMRGKISGTEMTISLPQGLSRRKDDSNHHMMLLCNDDDCSTELNYTWDGKGKNVVLEKLELDSTVNYTLKVPVTLDKGATVAANSEVKVTLTQSQKEVDQDTRERVVEWVDKGALSALVATKPVEQKTRDEVAILPLKVGNEQRAGSAILVDKDHFTLSLNIRNAQDSDKVTLLVNGNEMAMKRVGSVADDGIAHYVAENLAIPSDLNYSLEAILQQQGGAKQRQALLGKGSIYAQDPRHLSCKKEQSITTCTLHWGAAIGYPVPFAASDALLSMQALKPVLTPAYNENAFKKLVKDMNSFNANPAEWVNSVLFKQADWKSAFPAPDFTPPEDLGKSIMVMEKDTGPLPIKGDYHFSD